MLLALEASPYRAPVTGLDADRIDPITVLRAWAVVTRDAKADDDVLAHDTAPRRPCVYSGARYRRRRGKHMQLERFTVGTFQVNTYLLTDPATGHQAIVDTGETRELVDHLLARGGLDVRMILLTHTHLDHAGALSLLQAQWDVPTYAPELDRPLFETLPMQGSMFGMPHLDRPCGRIDHWIHDGFSIALGETTLRFLSTPGHTPGQGCWHDDADILVGDTVFAGSIGRVDFPLSDPALAVDSLRRLFELPGHLRVHSGHGPMTTLEQELRTNPYLAYLRRERGMGGQGGVRWAPGT